MLTTARTSVHGAQQAQAEWRRIVDLATRHGLGAVPATRPEFGAADVNPSRRDRQSDSPVAAS